MCSSISFCDSYNGAVMSYCVIDLETTIKEAYGRKANSITKENLIVASAQKLQGANYAQAIYGPTVHLPDVDTLVGHNLKFDLLHLWPQIANSNYSVWDTQLAEHILTGQQSGFSALRVLATSKYGAAEREKRMEQFWEQGICTSKIPKSIVIEDVTNDVLDTEIVVLNQLKEAKRCLKLTLIKALGNGLLASCEMESNGIYINRQIFDDLKGLLEETFNSCNESLTSLMGKYLPKQITPNLNSKDQISAILFGGTLRYQERVETGEVYKTGIHKGEPKTKLIEVKTTIAPLVMKKFAKDTKKEGVYIVDDEALQKILEATKDREVTSFVSSLSEFRQVTKDYNTYYKGIEKAIYHTDSCLHPQFNFVATDTGRLSSSSPNAQNLPKPARSELTRSMTSRFSNGTIIGFDYNQLEVVGLALLSDDELLSQEIRDGVDIHRRNASWLFHIPESEVTDEQRQITKGTTFKLLYGGSAYSMAATTGLELGACEEFIAGFFAKYKQVKAFYQHVIDSVRNSRTTNDVVLKGDMKQGIGKFQIFTGRTFTFKESLRMTRNGAMIGFNRPDLMNYPIQGVSTGDIATIMLGELYSLIKDKRDKFRL